MRRYGGGILYAALPLHMQRGCFRIRTHDQQVTKAQLYRCTRARPQKLRTPLPRGSSLCEGMREGCCTQPYPCIYKEAVSGFEPMTNKSSRHNFTAAPGLALPLVSIISKRKLISHLLRKLVNFIKLC